MENKNSLKQKWVSFGSAFLAPVPIFSLLSAVILILLSIKYKNDISFSVLIYLIGSLLIGIAGAFIKGRYDELINESVLIKKGESAIRNLDSIGRQVIQIRGWIEFFVSKKEKESKESLKEIDRHLSTTEIHIKSGIADWIDIIPELKRNEEVIKNYQDVIKSYLEELLRNKKELLGAGENKELREKLEKRIKDLEKNVKELKKESPQVFSGGGINATQSFLGGRGTFVSLGNRVCFECGKPYSEEPFSLSYSVLNRNLCPECKKKHNLGV